MTGVPDAPSVVDPTPEGREPAWGVGAVAKRVGIAANTLRSWDRRYSVGPSRRSAGGHRRYGSADVQRIEAMIRMTDQGVPTSIAAEVVLRLEPGELVTAIDLGPEPVSPRSGRGDIEKVVAAAVALDAMALRSTYREVLESSGLAEAWTGTLVPALQQIGQAWAAGRLGIPAERLASEILASELRGHTQRVRIRRGDQVVAPSVVLASADEEQHYLPLLALEGHLVEEGVESLLLGPRVPPESLLGLLGEADSPTFFVWASMPRPVDDTLFDVLGKSLRPLNVVIGGPGWPLEVAGSSGAVQISRVHSFSEASATLLRLQQN